MANFNKVILAGRLTRDPEMRHTPTGHAYVRFGLAVSRTWKNEAGETKAEVAFVDIEAWARRAELFCQYLKKGDPLLVEGHLRYDTWEDKQTNQKRSKLLVVVDNSQFIGSARRENGGPAQPASAAAAAAPGSAGAPESPESAEPEAPVTEPEDVPF